MPRQTYAPPANVNIAERTVLGLDYRKIVILAIILLPALGVMLLWREAPLFLRAGLAVLIAGAGLAAAFGQIHGKPPEKYVWDRLSFNRRKRWWFNWALRGRVDSRRADLAGMEAVPVSRDTRVRLAPDFVTLTADAIGLSVLTMLSIWLSQDGARQLAVLWWGLGL